jgi:hypothetical protein
MANTKVFRRFIFFLLALSFVLSDKFVGGRRIGAKESKQFVKHKGTLKTIEVIMNILHLSSFLILILILDNLLLFSSSFDSYIFLENFLSCLSMI